MSSCLILSHGYVAEAYLEACQSILGECPNIYALSCGSLTPQRLYEKITDLIETKNLKDGLFIFVSLRGGSYWNAAAMVAKENDQVELISGLNLSLILCFATKRDQYRFEDLAEVLLNDARRGITRLDQNGIPVSRGRADASGPGRIKAR